MRKIGKSHYLYRHIRLDKNQPFYIGIGTKKDKKYSTLFSEYNRAYTKSERNRHWNGIVKSIPYEVEIMMESDDYEFIKEKEKEFIKLYGREDLGLGTLVNLTDGGDGAIGCIATEESRIKKSKNATRNLLGKTGSLHPCAKPIYQYKLTGEFIKKYDSVIDGALDNGISKGINTKPQKNISFYCGNFLWSFNYLGENIDAYKIFDYETHKLPIRMLSLSGEKLEEFESITEAAITIGSKSKGPDISKCLRGLRKTASGYKWEYIN